MIYIIFLCFSLINHVSFGADTISGNQSLSGDQTIVSLGGNFELGFFQPGNSSNFYIGIWYKKVSIQTVVWVANRETPISDKYSSDLKILNGNLVLLEFQTTVWSADMNSTTPNNSVVAVLRDDGNFVLKDESSSIKPVWQSFDYPTHTFLPGTGSKIGYNKRTNTKQLLTSWKSSEDPAPGLFSNELDPNGSQFRIWWKSYQSYWTSGSWKGQGFNSIPEMSLYSIYNMSYVSNENESYLTFSLYNPSILSRSIMDVSGQLKQLSWLENSGEWIVNWYQPRQQCEVYAYCGAFSTCNQIFQPVCDCLPGFVPRNGKDWNLSDFSGGCVRKISLQCEKNAGAEGERDRFWEKSYMGLPQAHENPVVQRIVDCESICLDRCNCTAYANGISGCSIWYGELLNVKELSKSGGTGGTVFIRLAAAEFSNVLSPNNHNNNKAVVIGSVIGSVAVSVAVMAMVILRRWKNKQGGRNKMNTNLLNNDVTQGRSSDVPFFHLKSIISATDGFSVANKLGEGGFGPVYKGNLPSGQKIAVKRLSTNSGQGIQEFKNEVILISKLQHQNLVKLLGFCVEGNEKLLIYEYMPNKSLDAFLSGSSERGILDWDQRYNIIEGIARGLLYLHRDSRLRVIHRDLKPSNILLDEDMNPKISDFGIAKMFGRNQTLANTNRIVGTYGYMSPEYAMRGLFSEKSDIFSFGVLILEIVSSKKNTSFHHHEKHLNLLDYAWQLWNEGKALELMDPRLPISKSPSQVIKCIHVGLLCVQEKAKDRPTISTIVFMLCNEATPPTPKQPAFILDRDSTESNSSLPTNITCSTNCVSITTIDGR